VIGAVLACGEGALLAGLAGAWWLGLVKGTPPAPEVLSARQRTVPGVLTRCCRTLHQTEGRTWRAIPTTTAARTLTDLASILPLDAIARACHEAGVLHRIGPRQVEAVLARRPNTPGAAKLRAVISGDVRVSLSELERRFLDVLRREHLPLPRTNRVASGKRVDCRWAELKVTVELDSFQSHNSRHTWEQDRAREREAYARGDHFRRYTYGDVFEHPAQMLTELHALLRPRQATGAPGRAVRP
ncbi:MAG TPA: hypothetical protein VFT42_05065, partial [Solirubrobacteraceae bacterium]|nr:hypothetical protein [Solirubrobacteraceae bacterium]